MQKIIFCTTCKGRLEHLKLTLPGNLAHNPNSTFLVLDYGDEPELGMWVNSLNNSRVIYYRHEPADGRFHMAHAKNMAARCAMYEGADIVVTLDADNFAGRGFESFVRWNVIHPGQYCIPDFAKIQAMPWGEGSERPMRGFAGRLAIRVQDFMKMGGYDQRYDTWRGEDIDLNARLSRMGYKPTYIPYRFLETIPHSNEVRFKEFPHARQWEKPGGWRIEGKTHDTVVNYGNIGCGIVQTGRYPTQLRPLPTRVFGIGMQKTGTTSLHRAFEILGYDSLHWGRGEAALIWQEMNDAGRSVTLERFNAISDMPMPLLYQKLDEAYPGSKFILTVRDQDKWLKSVERMWDPLYNPTRWMWDVWPISNRLHKAMYGREDFDEETMARTYTDHMYDVCEYFHTRPDDMLFLDMDLNEHPMNSLCEFLNLPLPDVPYPHEYKTKLIGDHYGSY